MKQKAVRWIIVVSLKGLSFLFYLLPWKAALWGGGFLGRTAFRFLKRERSRALNNFTMAFGGRYNDLEKNKIVRRSFENLGKNLAEVFKFRQINKKNIDQKVTFKGEASLKQAFANGQGIVFVTAHFGNWELMGAALSIKGYPTNVIAAPLYDPRLDQIMNGYRMIHGVQTITRGEERSGRRILSSLKKNQILGLLIDQDIDADGVFVNFFNRKAYTPSGAASLALKSGASVIFGFIRREENDHHTITLEGPVPLIRNGSMEQNIHDNTAYFTKVIEENINRHPDQWVWMHNRWETEQPPQSHESS
jgi:KDO2-lipid IV(A) lauroyltransferase